MAIWYIRTIFLCLCTLGGFAVSQVNPDMVTNGFLVVPRFVLRELQQVADSNDPIKRARGRRGLDMLSRIQHNKRNEVKIHEADFPEDKEVDTKLVRLAKALGAKLYTNDSTLGK